MKDIAKYKPYVLVVPVSDTFWPTTVYTGNYYLFSCWILLVGLHLHLHCHVTSCFCHVTIVFFLSRDNLFLSRDNRFFVTWQSFLSRDNLFYHVTIFFTCTIVFLSRDNPFLSRTTNTLGVFRKADAAPGQDITELCRYGTMYNRISNRKPLTIKTYKRGLVLVYHRLVYLFTDECCFVCFWSCWTVFLFHQ